VSRDAERRAALGAPSPHFTAQVERIRRAAALGPILDLACGHGRHAVPAADLGLPVVALDRDREALATLTQVVPTRGGRLLPVAADLEGRGAPPLRPGGFGAVLVFRYLHRPLFPAIEALLAPGGLLLYETFTLDQRALGWGPGRDAFLLGPGELARAFPGLEILDYTEGPTAEARPAHTARLLARRPASR